jgi:hypothetical protein
MLSRRILAGYDLANDMYRLDEKVVGNGMGLFLIVGHSLAAESAAKLKRKLFSTGRTE